MDRVDPKAKAPIRRASLRSRILGFVGALIVLSLLGSTISLYRITEVNRLLDAINRVSVPLGRLFTQIQADAELLARELDRGLGNSHWKDPHWRPRPVPRWIADVLESEVARVGELMKNETAWAAADSRVRWQEWASQLSQDLTALRRDAARLATALEQKDLDSAAQLHPALVGSLENWQRQLQWGAIEYERSFRQTFSLAESRVTELRTGLEMILVVVVALSLLLLWLGERALRPLGELTGLAREITRRGLRKEDKALLPEIAVNRDDEVGQLRREFLNMATALLEREKTVETQKQRLVEQNRLLREMGELNENVLKSIEPALIVVDLEGKIAQANPAAARWLDPGAEGQAIPQTILGTELGAWPRVRQLELDGLTAADGGSRKLEPRQLEGRMYGAEVFSLKGEAGEARGAILVVQDLTEELDLQERLRRAENLAAVGRMSAQVAHEVRNPLHSIGLEAEIASDLATRLGNPALKQALQSILSSVDRLEKITENYLKLSKLSAGAKGRVDLGEVLEAVLATYAPVCESRGVKVDWKREAGATGGLEVFGDRDLLEQVLGNLFRNALQAVEGPSSRIARIEWSVGRAESGAVWVSIRDNGPGISEEVRARLFTPFVTTRAQGTGLGLSFVKKVIEDHGGRVVCAEPRPGEGARFEVSLPAAPELAPEGFQPEVQA